MGESIELAPRDPDPNAPYSWTVDSRPAESTVSVGRNPVEHLVADVPGRYVVRLSAPDGKHTLTVRAFPGEYAPDEDADTLKSGEAGRSGRSGRSGGVGQSGERGGSGDASSRPETVGDGGRPRLRLDATVVGEEAVVRATPRPHPESDETPGDLDVEFVFDDRDDIDSAKTTTDGHELRIPVAALPDRTRIHAVAVAQDRYSVPDQVELRRRDGGTADIAVIRPYDPPAWAANSVIYEVYVRTFPGESDTPPFETIIDRLDYIESLGVDVLWLTPILQNDHAPHGYNITDFFSIASDLGTRADYERLIEAAHDRNIKVLFDMVCNHSARTHPFFEAARSNRDSEYREWYEWRTETEPETYFEWEHIANFNFDHLPVRRHLLDAVETWMSLVDGFRCDMAWAVPDAFWRELHDRCKDHDREFLLLDETIPYIPDFQAGVFDMHFDSTTYFTLRQIGRGQPADTLLDAIDERKRVGFPDHAEFMLYSENHDETRYISECGRPAAEAAVGALFTLPGAPMIYAGQEIGHRGRRDPIQWEHAHESLQDHVRRLATVRAGQEALQAKAAVSAVEHTVRKGDADRVVAYARRTDDEAVVVVLNFGSEPAVVSVSAAGGTDLVSDSAIDPGSITVESVVVAPANDDLG